MKKLITILFLLPFISFAKTLLVGESEQYQSIEIASLYASSGDTILVRNGVYPGGMYIENLQGTDYANIFIIAEEKGGVIIRGGGTAIQFTDAMYLTIQGFIIEGQTANGMNFDDGGTYESPSESIAIENCTFRDINATGNNDLLKMSGVDDFLIYNCIFENGAAGGSGIDMVGCHIGLIMNSRFKNMGSNAIQAKGGTQDVEIYANYFENCGERTLNLGGSTGLEYFRPKEAGFEAADLNVFSNIFIGSVAPISFVGSIRCKVINNTIINPEKWVIRILQETVNESRFAKCGENTFENNLIYISNLSTETNIGPYTAPETFTFNNNFWYNYQNQNWDGPEIPVPDTNQRINLNPEFIDFDNGDYRLSKTSPAREISFYKLAPEKDYLGNVYSHNRSAGAYEYAEISGIYNIMESQNIISPNPAADYINVNFERFAKFSRFENFEGIKIFNSLGEIVMEEQTSSSVHNGYILDSQTEVGVNGGSPIQIRINISHLTDGLYFLKIGDYTEKFVVFK